MPKEITQRQTEIVFSAITNCSCIVSLAPTRLPLPPRHLSKDYDCCIRVCCQGSKLVSFGLPSMRLTTRKTCPSEVFAHHHHNLHFLYITAITHDEECKRHLLETVYNRWSSSILIAYENEKWKLHYINPKGKVNCRRKSSTRKPQFKVSSEGLSTFIYDSHFWGPWVTLMILLPLHKLVEGY